MKTYFFWVEITDKDTKARLLSSDSSTPSQINAVVEFDIKETGFTYGSEMFFEQHEPTAQFILHDRQMGEVVDTGSLSTSETLGLLFDQKLAEKKAEEMSA